MCQGRSEPPLSIAGLIGRERSPFRRRRSEPPDPHRPSPAPGKQISPLSITLTHSHSAIAMRHRFLLSVSNSSFEFLRGGKTIAPVAVLAEALTQGAAVVCMSLES